MRPINVTASILEHDGGIRYGLIREFRSFDVTPKEFGDRLDIQYQGDDEIAHQIIGICESCRSHIIRISRWEG